MLSRREFLYGTSSALLLSACEPTRQTARKIDKIGLQTYTFRDALAKDFRGTFEMIKAVGFDYVELNERNYSEYMPMELKDLLDEVGLPSPASHISYGNLSNNVSGIISTAKILGCEYMILPYISEDARSLADWKRHAALLNQAGEKMASEGVKLAYHNHQFEFDDLGGGTTAMDILMSETNPDFVSFQLDFFWAHLAKQDIPALIKAHPGRFPLSHVKDIKGSADLAKGLSYEEIHQTLMVDVGKGDIPFSDYLALNEISGMKYFIAEHDGPKKPYRETAENLHKGMKAIRF